MQEVLVGGLPALRRARLHARLGAALEQRIAGAPDDALVERLAHHFVEALPVAGPGPARRYSAAAAQAARARLAHGEAAGAHPAGAGSCSTRPSPTPPAPGTTCSPRSATTCCAAGS